MFKTKKEQSVTPPQDQYTSGDVARIGGMTARPIERRDINRIYKVTETVDGRQVLRYTDTSGRTCAFYDTALLFPLNALRFAGTSLGVAVLDMSDPAHPRQTDKLTELPIALWDERLSTAAVERPDDSSEGSGRGQARPTPGSAIS